MGAQTVALMALALAILAVTDACSQERAAKCTNGSQITVPVGQHVELQATSPGGIPYLWQVRNEGAVLDSVPGSRRAAGRGQRVPGGSMTYTWTFVAAREGTQSLGADLVGMGPDAPVAQSVRCTVMVRAPGEGR